MNNAEPNLIIENLKAILEECTASEDAVSYVNREDAGTLKAAIEALEKQEQDRWHPVAKEGNPPKSGRYIVVDNGKMDGAEPHTRYFNARGDASFWSRWGADEVIAWRPLPEPYTEEES